MTVNLLKMSVGTASIDHLRRGQRARAANVGGRTIVPGYTRNMPRRRAEIIDGGSIYWIIKGVIAARQPVLDLLDEVDGEGRRFCRMHLDPELVATDPVPHRPMQGWRYLEAASAPRDLDVHAPGGFGEEAPPAEMLRELRALGLL